MIKHPLHSAYAVVSSSVDRVENDYYPTPPVATYALIKTLDVPDKIWEPAAGRGWISHELIRNGKNVYSSDL